ncbi:MAG TPA: uroporphyrinogen-III synthase [Bryobacteraceae bacterium]|jgi:uroporphyrinogen-III synthase
MGFDGLRVLSLESRRAAEIERLIRSQGGVCFVAPSMREVPLEQNLQVFDFAAGLLGGDFDLVVFLTGVGARLLRQVIETRYSADEFLDALRKVPVVVRGSKPAGVMREWGVPIAVSVPEPNTWREILAATEGRTERRIAVQEYGRPSQELLDGLRGRGATVTAVPVYAWELPEDLGPLREAARRLAAGEFDVVLLTTSMQVVHLLRIAAEEGMEDAVRRALGRAVVASVGPTTSETLRELGLAPDFEPSHPKMGFLVNEIASRARDLLQLKQ